LEEPGGVDDFRAFLFVSPGFFSAFLSPFFLFLGFFPFASDWVNATATAPKLFFGKTSSSSYADDCSPEEWLSSVFPIVA
jgi:hypothetical protein